jgi:hypothetical protein
MTKAIGIELEELDRKSMTVNDETKKEIDELLNRYELKVGKGKKETCPRNLTVLLRRLSDLKPEYKVKVVVYGLRNGSKKGQVDLVKYQLISDRVDNAIKRLMELLITPSELMHNLLTELHNMSEYCDVNTVAITGLFDTHGIAGNTFGNPCLPITQERANMMYEAMKSHAENYKDRVKKMHPEFKFKDDSSVIAASMSDLKKITGGK